MAYIKQDQSETSDQDPIPISVSDYVLKRKNEARPTEYPICTEKKMLACIAESDRPKAQQLLNKLLGHILFSSDGDFERIKSEAYQLLVLISRAAMDVGVSADLALRANQRFWKQAQSAPNLEAFCVLLTDVMNRAVEATFNLCDKKNAETVCKAVDFMRQNCMRKITLEDTAKAIYFSPSYFSKVFKKELGCSFNTYLNRLRIEKSKQILIRENLRLAEVAAMVGFEDQSYFTKVFTRMSGTTPKEYRKSYSKDLVGKTAG